MLLINPDYPDVFKHGAQKNVILPPLGLEYIAANIEDIAEVLIIDNRLKTINLKSIETTIYQFQPDYVGISCNYSPQIYHAVKIANIAKTYGSTTVIGGWHPTLVPEETLEFQSVDILIRCEGEITFRELIQNNSPIDIPGLSYKKNGKIIHNPDRELLDLKHIKLPSRHYRSKEAKVEYSFYGFSIDCIETSRGCPYSCNFCCIHEFYRKRYRTRSIPSIIKELNSNEVKNQSPFIFIIDDNFLVDPKFVEELCNAIIQEGIRKYFSTQIRVDMIVRYPKIIKKMADAGFIFLFLGIESFSDRTLKFLNKQTEFKQIRSALKILHDYGYFIQGNIILGANFEDKKEDLESTIEIAKKLEIDLTTFSVLTPFPGTKLMEKVLEDNLLLSNDWSEFNWSVPIIKYPHLSIKDLKDCLNRAFFEVSNSKKLWPRIKTVVLNRGLRFHILRVVNVVMFKTVFQKIEHSLKQRSKKTNK